MNITPVSAAPEPRPKVPHTEPEEILPPPGKTWTHVRSYPNRAGEGSNWSSSRGLAKN